MRGAITESMKLIEVTGDLGHDLVEDFLKIYEEVQFEATTRTCSRCGAIVPDVAQATHSNWHKDITFRFFVIQSYVTSHTEAHIKAHADITKLLEEM